MSWIDIWGLARACGMSPLQGRPTGVWSRASKRVLVRRMLARWTIVDGLSMVLDGVTHVSGSGVCAA